MRVIRDGVSVELPPSKKTRALLAYLALSRRPYRREQLCELLWEIPDDPRGSLRWSLSKIRRLVDEPETPRVVADRTQVAFEPHGMTLDVNALLELAEGDPGSIDTSRLEEAVRLYRGDFLEGLELPNFHGFYSWCVAQRETVVRAQAGVLQTLMDRFEQDPTRCLEYACQLVSLVPYDDRARARYIELLKTQGRMQEAEQQYTIGRRMQAEAGTEDHGLLLRAWRGSPMAGINPEHRQPASPQPLPPPQPVNTTPTELLGRDEELAWLTGALHQCSAQRQTRLMLIEGDAGMGKTSLLNRFTHDAAQRGTRILRADAFEAELIRPFALWQDALRDQPEMAQNGLFNTESRLEREQLFTRFGEVVGDLASQQPLVIVFDDVQWCDESSAALLHYVVRTHRHKPLLLVLAARQAELRDNGPMLQTLSGLRHDEVLDEKQLRPLPQPILKALIHQQSADVDSDSLSETCAGNPLLAIELARAETRKEDDESLSDMLHRRLFRLDADVIDILRWAAVLAPVINITALGRVTNLERYQLDLALEVGQQQGILTQTSQGCRFSHDLVAQSIYTSIAPGRRQIMHRRVAELLEAETAQDLTLAAELSRHAARSGESALAARAMVKAGQLCLRFYANEDATSIANKGLQFAAELPDCERICLTLELANIKASATPTENWQETADEYVELAEQALDFGAVSHARLGYQMASFLRWLHGSWSQAKHEIMQAERITRAGDNQDHVNGMAEAAKCLAMLERDLPQADALLMEAQAVAARHNIHAAAIPAGQGMLRYFESHFEEAEELLQQARAQFKSIGDRFNEYQSNEYLLMIAIEQGDFELAASRCPALLRIGEKLCEGSEAPYARAAAALCAYAEGDDRAFDELQAHLAELRQVDAKQRLAYLLNRTASVELQRGQWQPAQSHAAEALACAECLQRQSEMLLARVNLARACEMGGDSEHFTEHCQALSTLHQQTGASWAREYASPLLAGP
ncbi:AAA family ATPase [Pseudomaricurvus alkylphenolicus]|uniref:ATP-binding protein n=1 Tax=Pseudomaricurvus alkylphenolicus TaxID=1306991 RepID=UPI00141FEBF9|nr:AAA family ATPase [Pseudomaricurvus alkylphenolicus]NIB42387.1 AAA family ATPase [Pseudomaricurvus alkylphenolicus]